MEGTISLVIALCDVEKIDQCVLPGVVVSRCLCRQLLEEVPTAGGDMGGRQSEQLHQVAALAGARAAAHRRRRGRWERGPVMTTTLRNFTSDNVEISIDAMASQRFGDYLNSIPLPRVTPLVHSG